MSPQRVSASGKNLRVALLGHIAAVIFNFITRRLFLSVLGSSYTGFSGLCAHLLNFLSLAEPGFDAACLFYLYKPLATGNYGLVSEISGYLRKIYRRIGVLTFICGIMLLPLVFRLADGSIQSDFALAVYLLSLAESTLSYFLSHRRILPISDQKGYIVTGYGYVTFILSRLVQLAVLVYTKNYIIYLCSGIVAGLVGEAVLYAKIGKMYPIIKGRLPALPQKHRDAIKTKVRSLFFCKVGAILCSSVDNMAVFAFLGLSAGTEYSNYTMLSGTCLAFVSIVTGSVSASVGNLGVTSGKERMKKVYGTVYFAIFMLSCFFAEALYFIYPIIVEMWVGKDMVLPNITTALFCLVMLVSALRKPTGIFLDGFGLFEKEKYKSLAEGIITLVATLILAPRFGINGVLAGQLCASLGFSFFFEPYILYRYGFRTSHSAFLSVTAKYTFAFILSIMLSSVMCQTLQDFFGGMGEILSRILICAFSDISVFFILFFDSEVLPETGRYLKKLLAPRER